MDERGARSSGSKDDQRTTPPISKQRKKRVSKFSLAKFKKRSTRVKPNGLSSPPETLPPHFGLYTTITKSLIESPEDILNTNVFPSCISLSPVQYSVGTRAKFDSLNVDLLLFLATSCACPNSPLSRDLVQEMKQMSHLRVEKDHRIFGGAISTYPRLPPDKELGPEHLIADSWATVSFRNRIYFAIADGVGHGLDSQKSAVCGLLGMVGHMIDFQWDASLSFPDQTNLEQGEGDDGGFGDGREERKEEKGPGEKDQGDKDQGDKDQGEKEIRGEEEEEEEKEKGEKKTEENEKGEKDKSGGPIKGGGGGGGGGVGGSFGRTPMSSSSSSNTTSTSSSYWSGSNSSPSFGSQNPQILKSGVLAGQSGGGGGNPPVGSSHTSRVSMQYNALQALKRSIEAFQVAQEIIVANSKEMTALAGGMVVQVEPVSDPQTNSPILSSSALSSQVTPTDSYPWKWAFIGASLGDCKIFRLCRDTEQISEVTSDDDQKISVRDAGGHLGVECLMDNLTGFFCPIDEGDFLICMTDGVHDNLDPAILRIPPSKLGLPVDSWKGATSQEALLVRRKFRETRLSQILGLDILPQGIRRPITPSEITQKVLDYVQKTTLLLRSAEEKGAALQRDWESLDPEERMNTKDEVIKTSRSAPGKYDHSTCVTILVEISGELASSESPQIFSWKAPHLPSVYDRERASIYSRTSRLIRHPIDEDGRGTKETKVEKESKEKKQVESGGEKTGEMSPTRKRSRRIEPNKEEMRKRMEEEGGEESVEENSVDNEKEDSGLESDVELSGEKESSNGRQDCGRQKSGEDEQELESEQEKEEERTTKGVL